MNAAELISTPNGRRGTGAKVADRRRRGTARHRRGTNLASPGASGALAVRFELQARKTLHRDFVIAGEAERHPTLALSGTDRWDAPTHVAETAVAGWTRAISWGPLWSALCDTSGAAIP